MQNQMILIIFFVIRENMRLKHRCPFKWNRRYNNEPVAWLNYRLNYRQLCISKPFVSPVFTYWAASWQNQQNGCAPSEDSDQPGHPPSLIRVFAVRSVGSKGPNVSSCGQRRLGGCPGWSESSLSAHSFCWFCHVAARFLLHCWNPRYFGA